MRTRAVSESSYFLSQMEAVEAQCEALQEAKRSGSPFKLRKQAANELNDAVGKLGAALHEEKGIDQASKTACATLLRNASGLVMAHLGGKRAFNVVLHKNGEVEVQRYRFVAPGPFSMVVSTSEEEAVSASPMVPQNEEELISALEMSRIILAAFEKAVKNPCGVEAKLWRGNMGNKEFGKKIDEERLRLKGMLSQLPESHSFYQEYVGVARRACIVANRLIGRSSSSCNLVMRVVSEVFGNGEVGGKPDSVFNGSFL